MPSGGFHYGAMNGHTYLFDRITIVGVGLLGGSLGLAARERRLCREVIGFGRSQAALEEALRLEAIDRYDMNLESSVAEADLVVLCTPVRHILETLPAVMAAAKPGAIITDVGSTKTSIVQAGEAAQREGGAVFVGSHPMAGSEKSGVRYARPDLFAEATCFVTKTGTTDQKAFGRICLLWQALHSRIVVARPERHDSLVAKVSHLPHLLAVALMAAIEECAEDKNLVKGIIGNGFRDMTRLAGGDSRMWVDICGENVAAIQEARRCFETALARVMDTAASGGEPLRDLLEETNDARQSLEQR